MFPAAGAYGPADDAERPGPATDETFGSCGPELDRLRPGGATWRWALRVAADSGKVVALLAAPRSVWARWPGRISGNRPSPRRLHRGSAFRGHESSEGPGVLLRWNVEELINALTHIKDLRVIARTGRSPSGQEHDVREIGRRRQVAAVLEGKRAESGGQSADYRGSLSTRRIDGHLWSNQYDRTSDDVLAIQEEITRPSWRN